MYTPAYSFLFVVLDVHLPFLLRLRLKFKFNSDNHSTSFQTVQSPKLTSGCGRIYKSFQHWREERAGVAHTRYRPFRTVSQWACDTSYERDGQLHRSCFRAMQVVLGGY